MKNGTGIFKCWTDARGIESQQIFCCNVCSFELSHEVKPRRCFTLTCFFLSRNSLFILHFNEYSSIISLKAELPFSLSEMFTTFFVFSVLSACW